MTRGTWILALMLALGAWACSGGGGTTDPGLDPGLDLPGDVSPDVVPELPGDVPGTETDVAGPRTAALSRGDFRLTLDADALTLTLSRGADRLLTFAADGLTLGMVEGIDDAVSYDPWPLAAEIPGYDPPWGLAFVQAVQATILQADATSFQFRLSFQHDASATVSATLAADGGSFALKVQDVTPADRVAYFRLSPEVDAMEAFYGLGAYLDDVNQRGKVRAMQLEMDDLEGSYNEAHVPVPFVIGTRGWGMFVASRYPGAFDVAKKAADRVEATFGVGAGVAQGLEFHLFAAAHPLDVTALYYAVTGYPRLPARWALGPWVWRNETPGQVDVLKDLQTIRDLDLATTAYWIDRPYASGVNAFDFDPARYTDPKTMIDTAHDLGFRMALWHTPYISDSEEQSDATKALLAEATAKGYFPPQVGLRLNQWGKPIDLTNPEAYAWWQGLIRRYADLGIEGYKLDYGEDVVPGILGIRNPWKFHDGSDERTMHDGFTLLYHQVYNETLPADGGFLLCRAGKWGDQVNVSVIWPGDLDATFWKHRQEFEDDGKTVKAVGGLPASLVYGLTLSPSGFPFFGADTGGYRHSPPDKELFVRWFEQTALFSVMQVGTASSDVAWEPTPENGFDAEVLDLYRLYTRLHLRLFPYEWTLAQALARGGRPITRPLGLAYPELGEHPNDTYLFGDDLLVAPVVTQGQVKRDVILPAGKWVGWWDGTVVDGGTAGEGTRKIPVDAPLGTLPLFLRQSGIVPLLRPTIDAIAPTTAPDRVDSYATTPGVLYPVVFPGLAASFELFDGTVLSSAAVGTGATLGIRAGSDFKLGAVFEVLGFGGEPAGVTEAGVALGKAGTLEALDAAASGWFWSPAAGGRLYVKVGPGDHAVDVTR